MRIIKIILLLALSLVLLLVVGLAAAVTFIDPNKQKERIAAMVYEQTGRELRIDGELEWGLWPRLRLAGDSITLGNAPDFGPEPFLELDSFSLAVATWPLIRSEVRLDLVEVSGLHLNLARNAEGIGNWEDLAGEPEPTAKPAAPGSPLPFAALALGGVDIRDLRVDWHDESSGQRAAIYDLNLQTGALNLGEPIEMELDFQAASNQPDLAASGQLQGTLVYDLRGRHYALQPLHASLDLSGPTVPGGQAELTLRGLFELDEKAGLARVDDFRLAGLGMLVGATMEMDGLHTDQPGCRGEIQADINDLVRVLEIFESPLAQQLSGVRERTVTLASTFDANPAQGRILVRQLEARLLGTTINGHLEATELGAVHPQVEGQLQAKGPDLPALLAVAARLTPGADLANLPRALNGLRDRSLLMEADFASDQDEIVIPNLRLRGLATELTSDWRLRDPLGDKPQIKGVWRLAGDDLPLLLRLASVFNGGPEQQAKDAGQPQPGPELWAMAQRVAEAGHNDFNFSSRLDLDLAAQRARVDALQAALLGLEIKAELAASQIKEAADFDLELAVAPFNPRQLLEILALEPPPTSDPRALRRLAINARAGGSLAQIDIEPLKVQLDDSQLTGQLRINNLNATDLAFTLNIDQLDLDRYLPPEAEKVPATPETAAAGAVQLPLELLRELRLDGRLTVDNLKISGLRLENFLFAITAADGSIEVQPLQGDLYGGKLESSLEIDAGADQARLATQSRLQGVQAGPLLRDLTGDKERLRGRAEVEYQLSSRGADSEQLTANLQGDAAFGFHDGAVVGVNIGRLLRQSSALLQGRQLAADEREAVTDFTELTGTVQITDGLASNRDLRLRSPLLRLSGEGTANLVSRQVDYLLSATVAATAEGQAGRELEELKGITVPIRVTGTFDDLSFRPELGAGEIKQLQQNLQEMGRRLQEDGIRALEGLLGAPPTEGEQQEEEPEQPRPEERLRDGLRQLFR